MPGLKMKPVAFKLENTMKLNKRTVKFLGSLAETKLLNHDSDIGRALNYGPVFSPGRRKEDVRVSLKKVAAYITEMDKERSPSQGRIKARHLVQFAQAFDATIRSTKKLTIMDLSAAARVFDTLAAGKINVNVLTGTVTVELTESGHLAFELLYGYEHPSKLDTAQQ